MKDAQLATPQVRQPTPGIEQSTKVRAVQADGQGITGEIAAVLILTKIREFHNGQSARVSIGFTAGRNEIEEIRQLGGGEFFALDLFYFRKQMGFVFFNLPNRRAKAFVHSELASETLGQAAAQTNRITFDHEIQIQP